MNELLLHSIYPNPAESDVTFSFTLPQYEGSQPVDFSVIDVLGRTIWQHLGNYESGYHEVTWTKIKELESGIYFVRLKNGEISKTSRLVLK